MSETIKIDVSLLKKPTLKADGCQKKYWDGFIKSFIVNLIFIYFLLFYKNYFQLIYIIKLKRVERMATKIRAYKIC